MEITFMEVGILLVVTQAISSIISTWLELQGNSTFFSNVRTEPQHYILEYGVNICQTSATKSIPYSQIYNTYGFLSNKQPKDISELSRWDDFNHIKHSQKIS